MVVVVVVVEEEDAHVLRTSMWLSHVIPTQSGSTVDHCTWFTAPPAS